MIKMTGVRIETERLLLRRLTTDDIDALVAVHAEPEVRRFMGLFDRRRVSEWLALVEDDFERAGPDDWQSSNGSAGGSWAAAV